ncbi:MAG: hypothetical protein JRF43_04600 [Deltaproteobacteria bacterium]|nr:hypothetical protein [Deltaproteobacteria bacterium]
MLSIRFFSFNVFRGILCSPSVSLVLMSSVEFSKSAIVFTFASFDGGMQSKNSLLSWIRVSFSEMQLAGNSLWFTFVTLAAEQPKMRHSKKRGITLLIKERFMGLILRCADLTLLTSGNFRINIIQFFFFCQGQIY